MQLFPPLVLRKRNLVFRTMAVLVAITCMVSVLAQTAFAQNTYVITDGDQTIVHTTYASDPALVLNEAGFALGENDTYTTVTSDGVSEITVQRGQRIIVDNCGKQLVIDSYGETVERLLSRVGIPTDGEYSVSVPLDTQTYNGLQFSVVRTVKTEENYVADLPFETTVLEDPTLPAGQEKVLIEGVIGQARCKANVVYVNGVEQSREILERTQLQSAVNRVVAVVTGENVGAKNTEPLIGDGVILLPTGEILTYSRTEQFVATAYSKYNAGCDDYTATGTRVRRGVVAVDPTVIPYGTRMFIVSNDGKYIYGVSTAEDCGGAIKGNRLDLYMDTDPECFQFGVRDCTGYFLGDANWNGK